MITGTISDDWEPLLHDVFVRLHDGTAISVFGEIIVDNQPVIVKLIGTDSDTALLGMAMLLEKEAIFNLKDMTVKVI